MSKIRIESIAVENYRSFKERQTFVFPNKDYKKPVAIVGYNNCGKSNLMDSILYGVGQKFLTQQSFELKDFHKRKWDNIPFIGTNINADVVGKNAYGYDISMNGFHKTDIVVDDEQIIEARITPSYFGSNKYYNIFFVNFHNIKNEIVTEKTSWGNLKSFLAKHIQKIVDSDVEMNNKKDEYESEVISSTEKVLKNSELEKFINLIRKNYTTNLRNDDCTVSFGLPNYEDIFLKMLFKVGLNGDSENLVPISHFGDGYISMFVMAVIQAISEFNVDDECLFLFEEPESFLHENHQEYFYKTVLCGLAEKGHQVVYTTHSDKMVDPFDTKGLIRLEINENNETVKKYNNVESLNIEDVDKETGEIIDYSRYNEFIKTVEPNLGKILFSKKVVLVEGPNDVLVYKYAIKQKILEYIEKGENIENKDKYADTFLNFENVAIICHHGKPTANYLIELCKHFKVDYFAINDWDFEEDELDLGKISGFESLEELKKDQVYKESKKKAMITINWKLINSAGFDNIHFNVKKLESVIGYKKNDKSSLAMWHLLNDNNFEFDENLFPKKLESFLGISDLINQDAEGSYEQDDDLPF